MQLQVCCDDFCPFSTEIGVKRGHKRWLKRTVECPPKTQQLTFECINSGLKEGICGLDDIFIDNKNCLKMFDGPDDI
uniref:Sortilin_C domain-containing protein n=1 Tax=Heterorhabditis bacteriophora TaxID=37862 RepID=A0A1I7XAF4_HETBA